MEKSKLDLLKRIFNEFEIYEIEQINDRIILMKFNQDIRLYIDANPSGIDFSIEAITPKASKILDKIESNLRDSRT